MSRISRTTKQQTTTAGGVATNEAQLARRASKRAERLELEVLGQPQPPKFNNLDKQVRATQPCAGCGAEKPVQSLRFKPGSREKFCRGCL